MATLKHIASKNSDYTAIEAYLVYQHDAFTGKQLLDEQGRPKLRKSYLLDTLECGDFSFATACLLANRKYGKNTQRDDIKSHQYIISFDPRDAADNGLTMEKAQALGLKFCEENFSGHPAIVCTHPDGHNHSGNIHVHIVIGSIRTREVERKPYMQKPRDWREGMKHSSTAQTMRHLRVEVMELCEGAGLYQIDLLNGSKERVSEAEYWARRRGQLKLDRENAALTAAGQPPRQKKFETVKDTLRKQISSVLYRATSFEDFSDRLMQQYGITVKESRGQLSYLPEIAYFARRGYKIFAFDNSGSHLSGGKSLRGLPQSAEDLDAALSFVTKTNTLPLYLFGHSWGGYAVSAVHCYHLYDIKAVFVQSGFDQTSEMVLEEGSAMMGRWIYILRAYIKLYERMKYGKAAGYTAHAGIAKATANGTKFLILHSTDDKTISLKNSVLANVEKNDNITLITEKNKGHNSLDSDRAIKHKAQLDTLFETTYPKNQRTNKNRRELFSEKVDKQIYYELDSKLMKLIADFYETAQSGKSFSCAGSQGKKKSHK